MTHGAHRFATLRVKDQVALVSLGHEGRVEN
jgi:hypothetical protein